MIESDDFVLFTCVSFTWYVALQGEYIRTFLPVDVSSETKFRNDLESPLAQGDAVPRPDTHVSPVKPLHAGGAGRAGVHLGSFLCAAERSLSAAASRDPRCVLIHIERATTSEWPDASLRRELEPNPPVLGGGESGGNPITSSNGRELSVRD